MRVAGKGKRRRKWRRRIVAGLALAVLLAVGTAAPVLRRTVQARLAPYAAGTVAIGSVRLASDGTVTLLNVRIGRDGTELASVRRVRLEGAVQATLRGTGTPSRVQLEGVVLRCVLARNGRWRVILPFRPPPHRRAPEVSCRNVTLVLPNGDRLTAASIQLLPSPEPHVLEVRGNLYTPVGEKVVVTGRFHRLTGAARLELTCDQLDLTLAWLRRIPPVGSWLARQGWVTAGVGQLAATLTHAPNRGATEGWSYEFRLDLMNARIEPAELDLPVSNLVGRIMLTPGRVELQGLSGTLGRGAVRIEGVLGQQTALRVDVRGVTLGDLVGEHATVAGELSEARLDGTLQIRGQRLPATWTGQLAAHLRGGPLPPGGLAVKARIEQGEFVVERARWSWGGGRFALSASGSLTSGVLAAEVTADGVRLDALGQLLGEPTTLNALVHAELHLSGPLATWRQPASWAVSGELRLVNIETLDRFIGQLGASLQKDAGATEVRLSTISAELFGIRLIGSGRVDLLRRTWRAQLRSADRVSVAMLSQFFPPDWTLPDLDGSVRLAGELRGSLTERSWQASVQLADVELEWNDRSLSAFSVLVTTAAAAPLRFATTPVRWGGGEVVAEGLLVTVRPERGLRVSLGLNDVELQELLELFGGRSVQQAVEGRVSGTVDVRWDCDPASWPECSIALQADRLRLDRIVLEQFQALVQWRAGAVVVDHWEARLGPLGPASGRARWPDAEHRERVVLEQLWLGELDLARLTPDRRGVPLCHGMATAELAGYYDLQQRRLFLQGTVEAPSLKWRDLPPLKLATGQVTLDGNILRLDPLRGSTCGGTLRLRIRHPLDRSEATTIGVTLSDVDLNGLLSARRPVPASLASGRVSGDGTITVRHASDRSIVLGYGQFRLTRARLAKVPVRHGRGVLYFDGHAYDIVFDHLAVGGGSADGTLTVVPEGQVTHYRASFAFRDLSLPLLCTSVLEHRHPVAGFADGSLELEVRSEGWHTANGAIYVTRLREAELWRLPLFYAIAEFLLPGVARPGVFHDGKGKIGVQNGVYVLDGFALRGTAAQIYIKQGKVWPDGRLQLEIIGNAETLLPAEAPLVGVIRRLADNVQHRLVKFYVSGTVETPRVRAVPLADVSGPALQFFRSLMNGRFLPNPPPLRR